MEWLSETISVGSKLVLKNENEEFPNEITVIEDYSFNGFFDVCSTEGKTFSITTYEVDNNYKKIIDK